MEYLLNFHMIWIIYVSGSGARYINMVKHFIFNELSSMTIRGDFFVYIKNFEVTCYFIFLSNPYVLIDHLKSMTLITTFFHIILATRVSNDQ